MVCWLWCVVAVVWCRLIRQRRCMASPSSSLISLVMARRGIIASYVHWRAGLIVPVPDDHVPWLVFMPLFPRGAWAAGPAPYRAFLPHGTVQPQGGSLRLTPLSKACASAPRGHFAPDPFVHVRSVKGGLGGTLWNYSPAVICLDGLVEACVGCTSY